MSRFILIIILGLTGFGCAHQQPRYVFENRASVETEETPWYVDSDEAAADARHCFPLKSASKMSECLESSKSVAFAKINLKYSYAAQNWVQNYYYANSEPVVQECMKGPINPIGMRYYCQVKYYEIVARYSNQLRLGNQMYADHVQDVEINHAKWGAMMNSLSQSNTDSRIRNLEQNQQQPSYAPHSIH